MAFNINAQVVLSGPKNIKTVRSNIKKQLSGITSSVKIDLDKAANANLSNLNKQLKTTNTILKQVAANATTANKQISSLAGAANKANSSTSSLNKNTNNLSNSFNNVSKSVAESRGEIENFGRDAALAIRRFSAFTIATGAVFGFVRAVKEGVKESIEFERQLSRVVQVTGATDKQIKGLESTIDGLAATLGLNSNELAKTSVTLAQTGQTIDQVRKSLTAISKASLAPTFGNIQDTTEGVIAALNQFQISADRTEAVLGSLNAVSKRFAVESEDLISVIRRAGGVFATAAGDIAEPEKALAELVGIFTAVRSTTRESADTIATGLRTIFSRIQRKGTIEFLKNFNIELTNAQGQFVGFFEGFRRIAEGLNDIQRRGDTITLGRVVEELGGIRQIGKILPAIQQFTKAEEARAVALAGTESITKDVAIATQTLAVQIQQLQARFQTLIKDISQSTTFQRLASFALSTANAFITLADALKPVIPLLTTFATIKIGGAALEFAKGFVGGIKKGGGAGGVGKGLSGAITGQGGGGGQLNLKPLQTALTANTNSIGSNTSSVTKNTSSSTTLTTSVRTLDSSVKALTVAIGRSSLTGGGGTLGRRRRALGGSIPRFQKGGFVHGPGHAQGGVIAELEGGEFVVPKKQVQKFDDGGEKNKPAAKKSAAKKPPAAQRGALKQLEISGANDTSKYGVTFLNEPPTKGLSGSIKGVLDDANQTGAGNLAKGIVDFAIKNNFAKAGTPATIKEAKKLVKNRSRITATNASIGTFSPDKNGKKVFEQDVEAKLPKIVNDAADSFFEKSSIKHDPVNFTMEELFSNSAIGSIQGQYFEAFTRAVLNSPQVKDSGGTKTDPIFDFQKAPEDANILFTVFDEPNEFKNTGKSTENINSAIGKGLTLGDGNSINFEAKQKITVKPKQKKPQGQNKEGKNAGGSVDTANSLLTPGEAVFGAKKASQIGINNLTRLNKTGDASGLNISNSDFSIVPGSGNSDTVPASLEPGSFVIKKSSTQEGLQGFNSGGQVQRLKRGGRLERFQGGGSKGGGLGGNLTQLALFASFADLGESANQLITLFFGLETVLGLFGKDLSDLGKGLKKQTSQTKKLTNEQRKAAKQTRTRLKAPVRGAKVSGLTASASRAARLKAVRSVRGRGGFGTAGRFGRTAAKIGGKGGLVPLVASLLVDPITQAIKDGFGEVELETGQRGFRGPGGLETAQTIGAASGGVSGALTGAGLGGLVAGPAGALIGAIAGAAVGGIKGVFDATAAQLEFQAFDQFNNALGKSTELIDEFNKNASAENLGKLNQATAEVFSSFERLAKNTIEAREASFSSQLFGGLDTNIFDSFSTASGLYEKSVFLFDKAAQFFGRGTSDLVKSIEKSATAQKRGGLFGDILAGIAPQIDKIASANIKGIEATFNAIPLDQLKALDFNDIDSLDAVKDQLTGLGVGAKDAEIVLGNLETALTLQGINKISSELPEAARKAFLGAASEALASGTSIADAVEQAFSPDQLVRLGITAQNAKQIVEQLNNTIGEEAVAELIAYQKEQVELSRILSETSREIDAFGAALNLLSGGIAGIGSDFSILLGNIQSDLDASLSNDFTVRRQQAPNVFENVTGRLPDEINNAVDNLSKILGTNVLDDAAEIVNLQNELPRALKDTVTALASQTSGGISGAGQFTDEQILDEFKKSITDFDKLPEFVQQNLEATLQGIVGGSRQGEGGKGAVSLQELLEEGNFDQLNQISVEFAENLSEIQSAVNDFQNAIAQGANNIKKINNLRLRTDLQINAKRQSFEDRFGKFLNQTVDERAKAEKRLRDAIDTQLRAGTGGPGIGAGGIDADALARRRKKLLKTRANIQKDLKNPELSQAEFDSLTKALGDNASKLDGATAALKTLSEDVTQLEAVEGELAKIQESRLTGRERAKLFASRAQDASSPAEFAKILQDFLAPTIAIAKAQQGGPIGFGEAAAILGDPQQIQDVFGFDDDQIESILAGTTQGIGDSFANILASFGVGRNAAPIARGLFGFGATTPGSTAQEQALLAEAANLQLEREKALLALRDQNITSAETLQQQFSDLIATTSQSLTNLITKAKELRSSSVIPPSTGSEQQAEQDIAQVFRNAVAPLDSTGAELSNAADRLQAAANAIIVAVGSPSSDLEAASKSAIQDPVEAARNSAIEQFSSSAVPSAASTFLSSTPATILADDQSSGLDKAVGVALSSNPLSGIGFLIGSLIAKEFSKGGSVEYRENGGSIFKPKGTDTVPAMLTPGEYVVNAKAVKKGSNLQLLQDINNGKLTYAQNGGLIQYFNGGSLTPIEEAQISAGQLSNANVSYVNSFIRAFSGDPTSLRGSLDKAVERRDDAIKAAQDSSSVFVAGAEGAQDSLDDNVLSYTPLGAPISFAGSSLLGSAKNISTGGGFEDELRGSLGAAATAQIAGAGAGKVFTGGISGLQQNRIIKGASRALEQESQTLAAGRAASVGFDLASTESSGDGLLASILQPLSIGVEDTFFPEKRTKREKTQAVFDKNKRELEKEIRLENLAGIRPGDKSERARILKEEQEALEKSKKIKSQIAGIRKGALSGLSIDQIKGRNDEDLIGRKIAAAKASGFLTQENLLGKSSSLSDNEFNSLLESELANFDLDDRGSDSDTPFLKNLRGVIKRTDPNKKILPNLQRSTPKNIVKTDITGKPLSQQSSAEREFDELIQRRIKKEKETGESVLEQDQLLSPVERDNAALLRNQEYFKNKNKNKAKVSPIEKTGTGKFGTPGEAFGEAASFLENVQSGRISGQASLIPSLPASQFSTDEQYEEYRKGLRDKKFGNESKRLKANLDLQEKNKPKINEIKDLEKQIAGTIPGSKARKNLERQLSELQNPKISSTKPAPPRLPQGSSLNGVPITPSAPKSKVSTINGRAITDEKGKVINPAPRSNVSTINGRAITDEKGKVIKPITDSPFINKPKPKQTRTTSAAKSKSFSSTKPQSESKTKQLQTEKPIYDELGNEITQNPSEELKAARQRQQEIKAAQLFANNKKAQTGERFDSPSGRNNIDPTTGEPITKERVEQIKQRERVGGGNFQSSLVDATTKRNRLERQEGKVFAEQRRKRQQQQSPASIPTDLPATLGPNPLLETKFSATGLENVDPVTLAGGEAQFAEQQARKTAVSGLRQRQQQSLASIPTDLPAQQEPATNLQQQENLRNRQERIRRTQGEGAASRFGQTFGLRNSGPGQRAGLPGGQGQGQAGAQDFTAFSDSVAKLQETTKSLTAFATQLNTAADKLAQLQTIEVSLNAQVAPIEVILNGASIINEFGDTAKKEIYNQLVTKLEDEFVKKTTDGSINEPTLGL